MNYFANISSIKTYFDVIFPCIDVHKFGSRIEADDRRKIRKMFGQ